MASLDTHSIPAMGLHPLLGRARLLGWQPGSAPVYERVGLLRETRAPPCASASIVDVASCARPYERPRDVMRAIDEEIQNSVYECDVPHVPLGILRPLLAEEYVERATAVAGNCVAPCCDSTIVGALPSGTVLAWSAGGTELAPRVLCQNPGFVHAMSCTFRTDADFVRGAAEAPLALAQQTGVAAFALSGGQTSATSLLAASAGSTTLPSRPTSVLARSDFSVPISCENGEIFVWRPTRGDQLQSVRRERSELTMENACIRMAEANHPSCFAGLDPHGLRFFDIRSATMKRATLNICAEQWKDALQFVAGGAGCFAGVAFLGDSVRLGGGCSAGIEPGAASFSYALSLEHCGATCDIRMPRAPLAVWTREATAACRAEQTSCAMEIKCLESARKGTWTGADEECDASLCSQKSRMRQRPPLFGICAIRNAIIECNLISGAIYTTATASSSVATRSFLAAEIGARARRESAPLGFCPVPGQPEPLLAVLRADSSLDVFRAERRIPEDARILSDATQDGDALAEPERHGRDAPMVPDETRDDAVERRKLSLSYRLVPSRVSEIVSNLAATSSAMRWDAEEASDESRFGRIGAAQDLIDRLAAATEAAGDAMAERAQAAMARAGDADTHDANATPGAARGRGSRTPKTSQKRSHGSRLVSSQLRDSSQTQLPSQSLGRSISQSLSELPSQFSQLRDRSAGRAVSHSGSRPQPSGSKKRKRAGF